MLAPASTTPADAGKLRGGYYTPPAVAAFLAREALRDGATRVLEPSCGDGEILAALAALGGPGLRTCAVELSAAEAALAAARAGPAADVLVGDAFAWYDEQRPDGAFDAVAGNPPFIRYQSFPETHREPAFRLMREEGLTPTRLTNAWVPFVVLATRALRPGGRCALVVPAEILQVGYAGQLREYLIRQLRAPRARDVPPAPVREGPAGGGAAARRPRRTGTADGGSRATSGSGRSTARTGSPRPRGRGWASTSTTRGRSGRATSCRRASSGSCGRSRRPARSRRSARWPRSTSAW